MAFAILLVPGVMAGSLDLQVSTGQQPPGSISACPDSVLDSIEVTVTNLGSQTDTVMLSLDWPADLGFIKPYQTLAAGESVVIDPFWITIPFDLEPGTYHAKVTAESSMTSDKVSEDIEIEVMKCHYVDMILEDGYGQSCMETQEPVVYDIGVVNQGKWAETFELSASVEWAEFSEDMVTVSSGESGTVSMILSPPEGISMGTHTVFVTARSVESYATASGSVEMEMVDCLDFSASLDPETLDACMGDEKEFELTINNDGEEDGYSIEVPDWVYPDVTEIELGEGESGNVMLTVLPEDMGISRFDVVVRSDRDGSANPVTLSGIINVEECRGVAVILSPSEMSVCRGEGIELSASIKNTGSVSGEFGIMSTYGVLSKDAVSLNGGESETVTLEVDTSEMPTGAVIIGVTVSEGDVSDAGNVELNVMQCYAAELSVQPDDVSACPGAVIPYTIRIENTGKEADTYILEFADQSVEVELEPSGLEVISHDYSIPHIDEGRYLFTVELVSENGLSLLESSEIDLKATDTCYGVELEDEAGIVDVGKATVVEIAITNTGDQPDTFSVSMEDGPEWAYIEPTEIRLGSGEEDVVYLYLSPNYGTSEGSYTVKLSAGSDHASDELEVLVTVPEDFGTAAEEPGEEAPEEGTGEPAEGDNVTINVTHPPGDGMDITGAAIEDRPFWKTAAVAIIALVIVIILVLRFVLLFKK